MIKQTGLAIGLVSMLASAAGAQDTAFMAQGRAGLNVVALEAVDSGRPVLNAPYSADAVTEVTQTLADGNRIEQRTTAAIARDSRGRIRREQQGLALGGFVAKNDAAIVTITDPSAGTHVVLNAEDRSVMRSKMLTYAAGARVTGVPPDVLVQRREVIRATRRPAGDGPPEAGATFELAVPPPLPGLPGLAGLAIPFGPQAMLDGGAKAETETLEPRQIEGLRAEGTKTTMTIAAGAVGNALPIEVVSERWYSPELQVVVLTRRFDPRFGETIYRLTNIVRAEPAADLFEVPADFNAR
jgi:hypothetical protein